MYVYIYIYIFIRSNNILLQHATQMLRYSEPHVDLHKLRKLKSVRLWPISPIYTYCKENAAIFISVLV